MNNFYLISATLEMFQIFGRIVPWKPDLFHPGDKFAFLFASLCCKKLAKIYYEMFQLDTKNVS